MRGAFLDELSKLRAENSNNTEDVKSDMVNISQKINKMDMVRKKRVISGLHTQCMLKI